jgi:hypothetical protein
LFFNFESSTSFLIRPVGVQQPPSFIKEEEEARKKRKKEKKKQKKKKAKKKIQDGQPKIRQIPLGTVRHLFEPFF